MSFINKYPYVNAFYETYKHNVYSQNGEDGILAELLKRLNITSGNVCEFGAVDGIENSNTFNLIKSGNFKGVYIERESVFYHKLLATSSRYTNMLPILAHVDYNPESNTCLDKILKNTFLPLDFDILSVDIDSYDYQVWKSFKNYRPKIVVIEINSGVDPMLKDYIHNPDKNYQGTSFTAMLNLATEKGYQFVCHTGNMIFVRNDLYDRLNLTPSTSVYENFIPKWYLWNNS